MNTLMNTSPSSYEAYKLLRHIQLSTTEDVWSKHGENISLILSIKSFKCF